MVVLGTTTGKIKSRSSATLLFRCMLLPASRPDCIPKDQSEDSSSLGHLRNGSSTVKCERSYYPLRLLKRRNRLRWTATQEWHDIYQQENLDDLQRFFDKYMLDEDNGWETTPRIRYSLLGYNRPSVVNEPAAQFPPAKFRYETLFLNATNGALGHRKPSTEGVVVYQADSPSDDGCSFLHTFEEYTELCGVSNAKVFMSTVDHDDMVSFSRSGCLYICVHHYA